MPPWSSVMQEVSMVERRPISFTGVGLLCPAGIGQDGLGSAAGGEVPDFKARAYVDDRKSLKLMTTAVRLGVSAIRLALDDDGDWAAVPPERRGIFVGASPQTGDPEALRPALEASMGESGFDMSLYGREGYPLIHPLWLVRGLSNNIIGFAAAIHDLQGVNANYCDGPLGGWNALREGALAVAEGRADLVVAGGADSWAGADEFLDGAPCGDGAGFVVIRPGTPDALGDMERQMAAGAESEVGFLGAATGPVALCRRLLSEQG